VGSRPALPRPYDLPASGREGAELRRLIQAFIRISGLLAGDETPCGHPLAVSQAHALMALLEAARAAERVTQRDLGRALGIDKSNVARLCRKMEGAGHLVQTRSEDDGRARLLSLTAHGRRLAKNIDRSSRDRFLGLMTAIPRRSRAGVLSSLACLNQALASAGPPEKHPGARQKSIDIDGSRG